MPRHPLPFSIPLVSRTFSRLIGAALLVIAQPLTALAAEQEHWIMHEVKPGESLREIARKYYGDSAWWLHIYHLNPDLFQSPQSPPQPGMKLKIRIEGALSSAAIEAPTTEPAAYVEIVVKKGDTLESLAAEHLGSTRFWRRILQLNHRQLTTASDIRPGMTLKVQDLPHQTRPAATAAEKYAAVESNEDSPLDQAEVRPITVSAAAPLDAARSNPSQLSHFDDFVEP